MGRCAGPDQRLTFAVSIACHHGAAKQSLRNAVFFAPTSFRAFASFRQAVRLACRAAGSPSGVAAVGKATGAAPRLSAAASPQPHGTSTNNAGRMASKERMYVE
jgi:hypothetical protein